MKFTHADADADFPDQALSSGSSVCWNPLWGECVWGRWIGGSLSASPSSIARLTPPLQFLPAEMKYGMQNIFVIQISVVNYKVLVGNPLAHPTLRK